MYLLHCKAPGEKRFKMLRGDGRLTIRRIYAARFENREDAERLITKISKENEGWAFEARKILQNQRTARR